VDQIGMQWIRRDVTVLFDTDGAPIAKSDGAVVAAALHSRRAALLLAAVNPVRKLIVGNDVIELRRWLVVPGAPGLAAVYTHHRSLIGRQQHDLRVLRIDPERVVIVSARRTFECRPRLAAISRTVSCDCRSVDSLFVARIDVDFRKVTAARPWPPVGADAPPRFSGIVRAINTTELRRIHRCIECIRIAGSNCDSDASQPLFESGQPVCQLAPGVAAIRCFIEAAAGSLPRAVFPWALSCRPQI